MDDNCLTCEHQENCEEKGAGFCYGCADEYSCTILEYCKGYHPLECNNGYTVSCEFDSEDSCDEDEEFDFI